MDSPDVTTILKAVRSGEPGAAHRLIELVHGELYRIASHKMRSERAGHTLQATALVNEAFMRLRGGESDLQDRAHFFGAAAKAMERVLVDHARKRAADKRGANPLRVTLGELAQVPEGLADEGADLAVLEVHKALDELEERSPDLAAIVRYRYFVGLTLEQISELEGVSKATLKRRWTFARAWLHERLSD